MILWLSAKICDTRCYIQQEKVIFIIGEILHNASSLVTYLTSGNVWSDFCSQKEAQQGLQRRAGLFGPLGAGKGDSSVASLVTWAVKNTWLVCEARTLSQKPCKDLLEPHQQHSRNLSIILSSPSWLCHMDLSYISFLSLCLLPPTHSGLPQSRGQPS